MPSRRPKSSRKPSKNIMPANGTRRRSQPWSAWRALDPSNNNSHASRGPMARCAVQIARRRINLRLSRAFYVAASKYHTMGQVSVAQARLAVVRAAGDIPRYLNPERGFATNILFGPPAIDPKQRAALDTYRKHTDGAVDKMMEVRKQLSGLDDAEAVASAIDALKAKFTAFRDMMDQGLAKPPEARRDAAK